jgi:predicted amidohydrolase YtcJ
MSRKADLILFSDAIFTGAGLAPIPGGVAIAGQMIMAVGSREEIEPLAGPDTQRVECGNRLITPGLCDAHGHYFTGALYSSPEFCSTLPESTSEAECVAMMRAFADANPGKRRYFGYGWFPAFWNNAPLPTKRSLDSAFPDVPIYLEAGDGHSRWVNTKALEECGYTRDTVPPTGIIDKFEDGELTGLLREGGDFLTRPVATSLPEAEVAALEEDLAHRLNSKGVTAFADMNATLPENISQAYRHVKRMEEESRLTLRLYLYPGTDVDPARIKDIAAFRGAYASDMLKICGLKAFADGVYSTYTAASLEPYTDKPGERGTLNYPEERYRQWVLEANRQGFGARVHCIGDRAVRVLLDIYGDAARLYPSNSLRNVIEHVEMIHPDDIPRFKEYGVTASMQPIHLVLEEGEKLIRTGKERSRYEWAFQSLIQAGAIIAVGTDYPVVNYDPFENIYAAITRKKVNGAQYGKYSLGEAMTLAQTLRAYTFGGAYANGMEHMTGLLQAGKYADIAVFSQNMFELAPEAILETEAVLTVCNGKIVYDRFNISD